MQAILRSNQSDDVRIGNVDLSELQVFRDGERQLNKRQLACAPRGDGRCMADVPVVEKHTDRVVSKDHGGGIGAWESYPTPKGNKESEPSECEDTTIDVNWVERRNRAGLPVDWIDHWGPPQGCDIKHCCGL